MENVVLNSTVVSSVVVPTAGLPNVCASVVSSIKWENLIPQPQHCLKEQSKHAKCLPGTQPSAGRSGRAGPLLVAGHR